MWCQGTDLPDYKGTNLRSAIDAFAFAACFLPRSGPFILRTYRPASRPDAFGQRAFEAMDRGFRELDVMVRITGDTIALSPPLMITKDQIGELIDKVGKVIRMVA